MTVVAHELAAPEEKFLAGMALCCDAKWDAEAGCAVGEPTEAAIGAAISEQRAQEIALAFMTQYVDAEGEAACTAQAEDSHWKVTFEGQADQQPCEVWIDNQTGAVLLVETFTR